MEKKKRGRKPKQFGIEDLIKTTNDFSIKESRILCIPIKYKDIIKLNEKVIPVYKEEENFQNKKQILNNSLNKKEEYSINDVKINKNISNTIYTYYSIPDNSLDPDKFLLNTKTDLCCWWCTYQFDTFPVYLPTKFNHKTQIFDVKGLFCSFECSLAYSMRIERNNNPFLVNYLHKMILKSKGIGNIRCAPPKEILQKFGGPISIEEFRQNNHNITYSLDYFPVRFIPQQIGVKRINELISKSMKKIDTTNKDISETLQKITEKEKPLSGKKTKILNISKTMNKSNIKQDVDKKENALSKFLGLN